MRTGRPKKENPKTKGVRLRLTEDEYAWIKEKAGDLGMSMSALLMKGAKNIQRLIPIPPIQYGFSYSGMYFCGDCQYTFSKNAKFCPRCGREIEWPKGAKSE